MQTGLNEEDATAVDRAEKAPLIGSGAAWRRRAPPSASSAGARGRWQPQAAAIDEETRASVSDPEERVRRFATEIIRREFIEPGARFIRAEHEMLLFASADSQLASFVRAWEARWVASIAGDLETAGWPQPIEAARTLMNLIRGYELERLLNPDSDAAEFRRRLDSVLTRTDRR